MRIGRANEANEWTVQRDGNVHGGAVVAKEQPALLNEGGHLTNGCLPREGNRAGLGLRGDLFAQGRVVGPAEEDAAHSRMRVNGVDGAGDFFGRPAFCLPTRARSDRDPVFVPGELFVEKRSGLASKGIVDVDWKLRTLFGKTQEPANAKVAIDGMGIGPVIRDPMRVKQSCSLTCAGGTDADGCAGGPSEETGTKEALKVDDQFVVTIPQTGQETEEIAGGSGAKSDAREFLAIEVDAFVQIGIAFENRGEGGADQPVNPRARVSKAQGAQHGKGVNDVAEGTGLDQKNAGEVARGQLADGRVAHAQLRARKAIQRSWATRISQG